MMSCGGARKDDGTCFRNKTKTDLSADLQATRDYVREIVSASITDELRPFQLEQQKLWAAISDLLSKTANIQTPVKGREDQTAQVAKVDLQKRVEQGEEHVRFLAAQVNRADLKVASCVKQINELQQQMDSGKEDLRSRQDLPILPPDSDRPAMSDLTRECTSLRAKMTDMEARLEQIGRSPRLNATKGETEVVQKSPRDDPRKAGTDDAAEQNVLAPVGGDVSRILETSSLPHLKTSSGIDQGKEDSTGALFFTRLETAQRTIRQSIWESAIFIGMGSVPIAANTISILVLLTNAFIQGCFCIIIAEKFTEGDLPTSEHMKYWRASAHEVKNGDPITSVSLVSRVCANDESLQVASTQKSIVSNAHDYLADMWLLNVETGPILFVLAWLLWALISFEDLASAHELMHAVVDLPRGGTRLVFSAHGVIIESVSSARVLFFGFVTLSRLSVCAALFVCGSLWLANEVNVQDLILNAAALGLIMDLDKLLFSTLMPVCVTRLVQSAAPLRVNLKHTRVSLLRDVGIQPFLIVLFISGFFIFLYTHYISSNINSLRELDQILCGGDKNFVWYQDELRNILITTKTPEFVEQVEDFPSDQQAKIRAAIQRWELGAQNMTSSALSWNVGYSQFHRFETMDMMAFTYDPSFGLPDCDSHPFYHYIWQPAFLVDGMLALAGVANKSRRGCRHLVHACGYGNASIIRAMCPSQCGCDSPLRGLFLSGPANGCPRDRCVKSFHYDVQRSQYDCSDLTVEELSREGWATYWEQFLQIDEDNGNLFSLEGMGASEMKELAMKWGCGALYSKRLIMAFCAVTDSVSGLVTFCPMTCGCRRTPQLLGCPHSCTDYVDRYRAALDSLPCKDLEVGNWTSYHAEWAHWATKRFEKWVSAEHSLKEVNLAISFTDFLNIVGESGCNASFLEEKFHLHGYLSARQTFCISAVGPLNLFSLCPEMCRCTTAGNGTTSGSDYCPGSCTVSEK